MKCAGPVFDQREHRPPAPQLRLDEILASLDFDRVPSATTQVFHEPVRSNATGAAIDQRRKRLRIEAARSPVPEHHGRGGPATQRLGL